MALRDTLVPVRYFVGPEPYYFVPDNTPLTDLKQRDDQLADAIDLLIPVLLQLDANIRQYLSDHLATIGTKGPKGLKGVNSIEQGDPGKDGDDSLTQGDPGDPGDPGTAFPGTKGVLSGSISEIGPYDWRNPATSYAGVGNYPGVAGQGGSIPYGNAIVGLRKPAESDGLYSRLYIRYRPVS